MLQLYELGRMSRDPKTNFDISVVHDLANLQCVLYHLSVLNKLLWNPFPNPIPIHQWWNGTRVTHFSFVVKCNSNKI